MGDSYDFDWPEARRRKADNPNARWDSIAREFEGEVWPALAPSFRIRPGQTVFTIGSCFARNIEGHLKALGCRVPMLSLDLPTEEMNGQPRSAMNRFHPPAFRQCLEWTARIHDRDGVVTWADCEAMAIRSGRPSEDAFFDMDMAAAAPASRARFVERRQHIFDIFRSVFSADCMMMTPGFIEAFKDLQTGLYIYGAPTQKAMLRQPGRWRCETLSFERCLEDMLAAIEVVRARNPEVKVLITTSPVPLAVTFSGRDVRVANAYSKSVLRAVCDVVAARLPMVDYFPSYETVTLSAPALAWSKDRLHVSQGLISRIVARMVDSYLEDVDDTARRYQLALSHLSWGEAADAAAAARSILEAQPDHLDARRALLDALVGQKDWIAAEREALALHALDPGRPEVLFRLAQALGGQDRGEEAMGWLLQALQLRGVTQRDVESVGKLISRTPGDTALAVATRAVELFPRQAEAYIPLVQILTRDGRYAEARTLIERARTLGRTPPPLLFAQAYVLMMQDELEDARRCADEALAGAPRAPKAAKLKAKIEEKLARRARRIAA